MFLELTFLKSLLHGAITSLMRQHKVLQRSWKATCNICYNIGNTSIQGILVFLFGGSAQTTKPELPLVSSFHHFIIMLFSIFYSAHRWIPDFLLLYTPGSSEPHGKPYFQSLNCIFNMLNAFMVLKNDQINREKTYSELWNSRTLPVVEGPSYQRLGGYSGDSSIYPCLVLTQLHGWQPLADVGSRVGS